MSYFSQIGVLTVQQFVSPAVGIAVAIAMVRGFSRRNSATIGNFWVDVTRCMLYILLPIAFVAGIVVVGQGAVQTLGRAGNDTRRAQRRSLRPSPAARSASCDRSCSWGPTAEASSTSTQPTTFENPTALTNWLFDLPALSIPFALTYTFGKMVGSIRHGAALLAAMVLIFGVLGWLYQLLPSTTSNPAVVAAGVTQPAPATWRARKCASATPAAPCSTCR